MTGASGWVITSAPVELAINLADLKNHLRLTDDLEDNLVELYARAATDAVERYTRRALVTRTLRLDTCWQNQIELPVAPVQAVVQVQYYDTQGTLTTLSPSLYQVSLTGALAAVVAAPNTVFPTVQVGRVNPVQIQFTAGYGDTSESIPKGLQMSILLLAGHYFVNRLPAEASQERLVEMPLSFKYALDAYKICSL